MRRDQLEDVAGAPAGDGVSPIVRLFEIEVRARERDPRTGDIRRENTRLGGRPFASAVLTYSSRSFWRTVVRVMRVYTPALTIASVAAGRIMWCSQPNRPPSPTLT